MPIKDIFTSHLGSILGEICWLIVSLLLALVSGLFRMCKWGSTETLGVSKGPKRLVLRILICSSGFSLIGCFYGFLRNICLNGNFWWQFPTRVGNAFFQLTDSLQSKALHLQHLHLEIHPQTLSEVFPSFLAESPLEWGHLKISFPSIIHSAFAEVDTGSQHGLLVINKPTNPEVRYLSLCPPNHSGACHALWEGLMKLGVHPEALFFPSSNGSCSKQLLRWPH